MHFVVPHSGHNKILRVASINGCGCGDHPAFSTLVFRPRCPMRVTAGGYKVQALLVLTTMKSDDLGIAPSMAADVDRSATRFLRR